MPQRGAGGNDEDAYDFQPLERKCRSWYGIHPFSYIFCFLSHPIKLRSMRIHNTKIQYVYFIFSLYLSLRTDRFRLSFLTFYSITVYYRSIYGIQWFYIIEQTTLPLANMAKKDRFKFILLFFPSEKLKRKAERVEAKQKTSEEKHDR
jgi:hypothetical protein